jgi:hypothetical protein
VGKLRLARNSSASDLVFAWRKKSLRRGTNGIL